MLGSETMGSGVKLLRLEQAFVTHTCEVIRCVMAKADCEHGNIMAQMMMCIITVYRGDVKRYVL